MSAKGGKILGLDFGEKRIGLAISDETCTFARELDILSPKDFWIKINQVVAENGIGEIVLGWPLNMNGQETKKTQEVKSFKLKVERVTTLPVAVMDERLTSVMAVRLRQGFGGLSSMKDGKVDKKDLDSLAAQILLQNYLDKKKHK